MSAEVPTQSAGGGAAVECRDVRVSIVSAGKGGPNPSPV